MSYEEEDTCHMRRRIYLRLDLYCRRPLDQSIALCLYHALTHACTHARTHTLL
jgi:hypothetical protein